MLLKSYADVSTVHGVGYVAREESLCGRLFWCACVAAGLCLAGLSVHTSITEWAQSPSVVTNVDVVDVKVSEVSRVSQFTGQLILLPGRNWGNFLR